MKRVRKSIEFKKKWEENNAIEDINEKIGVYLEKNKLYDYLSNEDALSLIELQKQINNINKENKIYLLTGSKFPKKLITDTGYKIGIVKEKYSNN